MKCISLILAACTFLAGIVAAVYWYRASKIQIEFSDPPEIEAPTVGDILLLRQEAIRLSINSAFQRNGAFNKIAAVWTGITALLAALSTVLGAIPN
jgi:hypothetical protein